MSSPFNLKILNGCSNFAFYPNLNGKRILLLGEVHTSKFLCNSVSAQDVHEYIGNLLINSNECIDVFLEANFGEFNEYSVLTDKVEKLNKYHSGIIAMYNKLYINSNSNANGNGNANVKHRIHNADPRFLHKSNKHLKDIFNVNDSFKIKIQKFFSKLFNFKSKLNLNKVLDNDIKIILIKYLLNLNDDFETFYEIYNAFNVNITKTELKEYMDLYFKTVKKELNKCSPEMKYYIQNILFEIYYEWKEFTFKLLLLDSVMDLYILSRLFMTFDKHKMNRGPINCRDSKYSTINNAIIYTGGSHTEHYMKFFYKLYNIVPNISISNDQLGMVSGNYMFFKSQMQCIKFTKPFNFFTSTFNQYENEIKDNSYKFVKKNEF